VAHVATSQECSVNISQKLDEYDRVTNAATEGPWTAGRGCVSAPIDAPNAPWSDPINAEHYGGALIGESIARAEDRAFVADARTTVPTLVAALRAVLDLDLVESAEWLGEMRTFTGELAEEPGNDAYMDYLERVLWASGCGDIPWGPVFLAIVLDRAVRETEKAITATKALGGAA